MFSNVWSENTALFERLMEIHSNSPKLYYGFKTSHLDELVYTLWGLILMAPVQCQPVSFKYLFEWYQRDYRSFHLEVHSHRDSF